MFHFDVENADPEDQILQTRIALLKSMLKSGPVDKEKQHKILYGHLQRKDEEQHQQQQQQKQVQKVGINNFRESVNIDNNNVSNSGGTNVEGNKKQKKQINDSLYSGNGNGNGNGNSSSSSGGGGGYSIGSGGYSYQPIKQPPPIISSSLKSGFDKNVKKYEKSKQLLGLCESVVEFDRGFYANHQSGNDKSIIIVQSPDAESNSSYLRLVQNTESIVAYYQYDSSAKKRKYNKVVQQLKREFTSFYHSYSRDAEEYFSQISSVGGIGANKYINYRRDVLGDLARVNVSFRNMPIFDNLELSHSATIIFYRRLLFICKVLDKINVENDEYLNNDGNDEDLESSKSLNEKQRLFLTFLKKVINSTDPLINITNDSEAESAIGNLILKIISFKKPPTTETNQNGNEQEEDEDDDDLAKQSKKKILPLIHLIIDDLPNSLVDILKILNNNIKVGDHKMYITSSCRFKVPAEKLVPNTRLIRLSNPNFYQNINYLDHCIEPLCIPDDGFNPHDYPNIYRALQFIGGQCGLNKLLASTVKQIQSNNQKTHVKNIVLDEILINILNILKQQHQQPPQQSQLSVFLLPYDNKDIPLLVLLSIVGYNFKEAIGKFPQIEEYYCKGVISIQNNSIFMAPLLLKHYLEFAIHFTSFNGNVFQKAYNILKRFSTETYIWNRFYQEFYEMKTLAYDVLFTKYPMFNTSNGKITVRSLFYPNQKLNTENPDDKSINYNDHFDIKEFSFRFVAESNSKKQFSFNHDTGYYDRYTSNYIGNSTLLIPSPPNLEFFTSETEKTVKESVKLITPNDNELILFYTRKFNKISNTPHFKIINPIESNYFSCFTSFVDSIEL